MTLTKDAPAVAVAMMPGEFARVRRAARYTQSQLAKKVLKCHPVHVSRMETGAAFITEETAAKMRELKERTRA